MGADGWFEEAVEGCKTRMSPKIELVMDVDKMSGEVTRRRLRICRCV